MKKYIATVCLTLIMIAGKAQTFTYSDNHVNNPTDAFVIGQVKNNIIVWCEESADYRKSAILIYDKNMHMVRKVTTDILHSGINPSVQFYHDANWFYVTYQYKKENTWEYRVARYDSKGTLSNTYVIDSLKDADTDNQLYYNLCQSADKKVLCCVKTISTKKYTALNFQFTFLKDGNLSHDSLSLSFDKAHERVIDFLVDNDKNVSLLKTLSTDTSFVLNVVKKEFLADHYLTASKELASGDLRDGTCRFYKNRNEYTVIGVWENAPNTNRAKNANYKTGFFSWQISNELTDEPGSDVILQSDSAVLFQITRYATNRTDNTRDYFGIQTDSTPVPPPPPPGYFTGFGWQSLGGSSTTGSSMATGSLGENAVGGGFYSYTHDGANDYGQDSSHYKASFSVASFVDNKEQWQTTLDKDDNKSLLTDVSNNKVVAGKNGLHILRFVAGKNKHYKIEHVLITYTGKYERINTTLWNDTYVYLIPYAEQIDDGSLIIPCVKGYELRFAKMNLE